MKSTLIVGLEIHVQLDTRTKMFCGCSVEFGAPPNSRTCPVCLGLPGALPAMNKTAFEHSVLTALALNCKIAKFTKWDRKSYYYPDMPKNYQISQYDLPLGSEGYMHIETEKGETKKIRIRRVHLEEDAGKNIHDADNFSKVDFNRAGTPLLEIVTEPDLSSGAEVKATAMELQRIVRYLGISQGDMQKGHMRFEPNINLSVQENKTPIVEVKNLNSFRALEKSVDYEARRQLDEFYANGITMKQGGKSTRGWDDEKERTVMQREKEEAEEYRYFPDPDLVPVVVDDDWLAEIRSRLCELPLYRRTRYVNEYDLGDYDVGVITAQRPLSDYFDAAVAAGGNPKRLCNLITQAGQNISRRRECSFIELGITTEHIVELARMADSGDINATAADRILEELADTDESPRSIAERLGLIQTSDSGQLEAIIEEVIAENADAVATAGSEDKKADKAFGFLMGQVMQKSKGTANPGIASKLLKEKLG